MSNPTSSFGWQMPTASDLVTDLPADFETFGQAVDTTLADLKGGTTGQVLSKASNTDMDFTWVAQDDSNAIQNAIVDAKGDLIAASAADTPTRLAVGNNGETLVADSSTSTGLRYQVPVNANPVLNSAFQVWQRGTSVALTTSSYTADRWFGYRAVAGATVSRQATNDTTNLPFIQYCARVGRDSGNTSTTVFAISQSFESINSVAYAGKTVTFSFYARAGANFSSSGNVLQAGLNSGTGTDQNLTIGFTGNAAVATPSTVLTTTWQRFTATGTVATNATQIGVYFQYTPTGTAGAADYFEVTGVQVEIGSVATPFKTYAATIQGELAACQRYYVRYVGGSSAGANYQLSGSAISSTTVDTYFQLPQTLRTTPSALDYANLGIYRVPNGTIYNSGTWNIENSSNLLTVSARYVHGSAVFTQGTDSTILVAGTTGTSYVGFSAEL